MGANGKHQSAAGGAETITFSRKGGLFWPIVACPVECEAYSTDFALVLQSFLDYKKKKSGLQWQAGGAVR